MDFFHLPPTTKVNRLIPKNAFDKYTNSKEKREFVDKVEKIRWLHKISPDTTNLPFKEVAELQIFELSIRLKDEIPDLVKIIDRSIPYPIIFILTFGEELRLSISKKHPHPTNEDNSILDWTFTSPWVSHNNNPYRVNLKQNIDFVFTDFCKQLSGKNYQKTDLTIPQLIKREQKIKELQNTIQKLEAVIARTKQFNRKVELNIELQSRREELGRVLG